MIQRTSCKGCTLLKREAAAFASRFWRIKQSYEAVWQQRIDRVTQTRTKIWAPELFYVRDSGEFHYNVLHQIFDKFLRRRFGNVNPRGMCGDVPPVEFLLGDFVYAVRNDTGALTHLQNL
jgi:hypothetical protein